MADINLNDLLENRQSDEGAPKSYEKKELVNFNRQVETLTAEERQQVDTIKESINLVTANAIAQYGIAAQNNIASFSNSILSTIKSTDKTAAGDLLNDLVKKVHDFEEEQEGGKGFLTNLPVVGSLFKKSTGLAAVLFDAVGSDRQYSGRPRQAKDGPHEGRCHVRRLVR